MKEESLIKRTKRKRDNFTQIENSLLSDKRMSFDTKGLLCYVLSKPNDWIIYKRQLMKEFKLGRTTIDRMFKEMEICGYMTVSKMLRGKDGSFTGNAYHFYDESILTDARLPTTDDPTTENGTTTNTIIEQILNIKDNIAETEVSAFSLHKSCVEYWCKIIKPEYVFTGKDGKHIKELYEKLRQVMVRKKGSDVSDEQVFESFKLLCSNIKNIDKFYHNADISVVNSQYNTIAEKIRDYLLSAKGKQNTVDVKPIWEQDLSAKDFQNPLDYENYLYLKNRHKNGTK